MPRVLRWICLAMLLLLLQANGCDDEERRGDRPRPSPSTTESPSATDASTSPSASPTPTETTSRLSGVAQRTGFTITRDNQPIDTAGLAAIGWVVDAEGGTARWTDPVLGSIKVIWEVPDERAVCCFDVSYWGEVTGDNLAMGPVSMGGTVFTFSGGATDTGAHSIAGVKAMAPIVRVTVRVPEAPTGSAATVSINLGFPQPVLVTYNYVFL
jgi:hypothetical protein